MPKPNPKPKPSASPAVKLAPDHEDAAPAKSLAAPLMKLVRELAAITTKLSALEAQAAPLAAREKELREVILTDFKHSEVDGFRACGLALAITKSAVPTLEDWDTFFTFARQPKNQDLLQRSVNTPAWRERVAAAVLVPGTTAFTKVTLRVSRG